jgi:hypothetical protein
MQFPHVVHRLLVCWRRSIETDGNRGACSSLPYNTSFSAWTEIGFGIQEIGSKGNALFVDVGEFKGDTMRLH